MEQMAVTGRCDLQFGLTPTFNQPEQQLKSRLHFHHEVIPINVTCLNSADSVRLTVGPNSLVYLGFGQQGFDAGSNALELKIDDLFANHFLTPTR